MKIPYLTLRDRKMLQALDDFGVLSTKQLQNLIFGGVEIRTLLRRLRKLERKKLICRHTGLKKGHLAWTFQPRGVGIGSHWKTSHYFKKIASKKPYEVNRDAIVPDGLFAAQIPQESVVIATELELHAKSRRRYKKVFEGYGGKNLYKLWYWVPTEKFGRALAEEWKRHRPYGKLDDFLIWTPIDSLLSDLTLVKISSLKSSVSLERFFHTKLSNKEKLLAHSDAHSVGKLEEIPNDSEFSKSSKILPLESTTHVI